MFLTTRKVRGVVVEVSRPVFPGYLFTGFDADEDGWQRINGTPGVKRLMTGGSEAPLRIGAPIIDEILEMSRKPNADRSWLVHFRKVPIFELGQELSVRGDGSFAGFKGICSRSDRERVWILLTLFGAEREVEVSAYDLAVA